MQEARLTQQQFILKAVVALRKGQDKDGKPYKGIHTVYTGFNDAFRAYFDGADPVAATTALEKAGEIEVHGAKGGAILYLAGEAPERRVDSSKVLAAILGA